eukprot:600467-Hanusia_phi.AAC.3
MQGSSGRYRPEREREAGGRAGGGGGMNMLAVLSVPVTMQQVAKLLAGPVGTHVRVELGRREKRVEVEIQRKDLSGRSVEMGSGLQRPAAPRHAHAGKKCDHAGPGE